MAVLANHSQTRATQYLTSSLQVSMANVLCWLVAILCLYDETMGQKTPQPCHPESGIRLESAKENSTCGFISGRVEICEDGMWKAICDNDWTRNDAAVACRQLGYSALGADVVLLSLFVIEFASTVPECLSTENNLTECSSTTSTSTCIATAGGVTCFLNDSAPDICFGIPSTTTEFTDTQATTNEATITPNQAITTPNQAITTPNQAISTEDRPLHTVVSHLLAALGGAVTVLVPVIIITLLCVAKRRFRSTITIATTDDITIATTNNITLSDNTAYGTHKEVDEEMYETIPDIM